MPLTGVLRAFIDDNIKLAPRDCGAYELLYNGTVVYIGSSSSSIQARIRDHRKRKRFAKVTHFRFKRVEWPEEAVELEAKLCKNFRKKSGGKPPRLQERTPKNRSIFDW